MKSLEPLINELPANEILNEAQVTGLKEILYSDCVIDKNESEFRLEINDAVSKKENNQSSEILFIASTTSFLLVNENSLGEIDPEEAEWLFEKINSYTNNDQIEKNPLLNIKSKAKSYPSNLELIIG